MLRTGWSLFVQRPLPVGVFFAMIAALLFSTIAGTRRFLTVLMALIYPGGMLAEYCYYYAGRAANRGFHGWFLGPRLENDARPEAMLVALYMISLNNALVAIVAARLVQSTLLLGFVLLIGLVLSFFSGAFLGRVVARLCSSAD